MLEIAIQAWGPVFERMRDAVSGFVFDNFYPDGWETRQLSDLAAILDSQDERVVVAKRNERALGWACIRLHPEDQMGEIAVLCVHPHHQHQGIGKRLIDYAHQEIRDAGMKMVMVETGDDPGHAPARMTYEAAGYKRWPVARYFKEL